jgi:hypothetical protein
MPDTRRAGWRADLAGSGLPVDSPRVHPPADRTQYLLAQPHEVCLEPRQHRGGGEIPGKRFVAVQQVLRVLFDSDVNRIAADRPPLQRVHRDRAR